MSLNRRQHIIFTLRPKYRRKEHSPMQRIEMPIKLERGGLGQISSISSAERFQIRNQLKTENKRIFWSSLTITLALLSLLVWSSVNYLNSLVQSSVDPSTLVSF